MSISDKAEKRRSILAAQKGSEPTINPLNYRLSLISALNWYNVQSESSEKKEWALALINDKNIKKQISTLHESNFRQLGTLLRIKEINGFLGDDEELFIKNKIQELVELKLSQDPKPTIVAVTVTPVTVKVIDNSRLEQFEDEYDNYVNLGYPISFKFKTNTLLLTGIQKKIFSDEVKKLVRELESVLAGEETAVESYQHVTKLKLENAIKKLGLLLSALNQKKEKVIVVKEQAPMKLVSKLVYKEVLESIKLKSEHPVKIINAKSLVLYNARYKTLSILKPFNGSTLTIKGKTVINYDESQSFTKTLRKESDLLEFKKMSAINKEQFFDSLNTKPKSYNGRINENVLIVGIL